MIVGYELLFGDKLLFKGFQYYQTWIAEDLKYSTLNKNDKSLNLKKNFKYLTAIKIINY